VKTVEPETRPELASAFEAAGDTAAQILLLPPEHSRRVIEEMMPNLPNEVGGGSSTILTRGLLWGAVGLDVAPQVSLRLVIQSRDREAAADLQDKWEDLVESLSTAEGVRKRVPDLQKSAALLKPDVEGDRLALTLTDQNRGLRWLMAVVMPLVEQGRERAKRQQTVDSLKRIALAMHNYHDTHAKYPAVGSVGPDGKPLLSWRVHILPYIGQAGLYKQFHLDEPWDSSHNRKLIEKMPETYRCPASGLERHEGSSTYRVVMGKETVFTGDDAVPMKEIKDGTSHTILVVEVDDANAVVWTKPEGLLLDPDNPTKGLGGHFKNGFHAALCDGSIRFIHESIAPKILYALFTRAGREVVGDY